MDCLAVTLRPHCASAGYIPYWYCRISDVIWKQLDELKKGEEKLGSRITWSDKDSFCLCTTICEYSGLSLVAIAQCKDTLSNPQTKEMTMLQDSRYIEVKDQYGTEGCEAQACDF